MATLRALVHVSLRSISRSNHIILQHKSYSSLRTLSKRLSLDQVHRNMRQILEPKYVVHFGNILAVCAMMQQDML